MENKGFFSNAFNVALTLAGLALTIWVASMAWKKGQK